MPTTYAHYLFGNDALKTLPKEYQDIIARNRGIYDVAVHGPDIFFYCQKNVSEDTAALGRILHHSAGKRSFALLKKNAQKTDGSYTDEDLAYIIGFLTHYILDSHCHPFVGRRTMENDVSHNTLEAQFDAYLLRKNGEIPEKFSRAKLVNADEQTRKTISRVYGISESDAGNMMASMLKFLKLLHLPALILKPLMKLFKADKYADLIMYNEEADNCIIANIRLEKLYSKALSSFPEFFENLMVFLEGKSELPAYFDRDFEQGAHYEEIPLFFKKEEEDKYTV